MGTLETLAQLVDDRLAAGEAERGLVSRLVAGGAFEAWLSFEARLLAEENRESLQLEGRLARWRGGDAISRYYFANEYHKVDLFIGELNSSEPHADICIAAIEFKLIHNNKNWKKQADGVWVDLFPSREVKAALRPKLGRAALVGFVAKRHREGVNYPVVRSTFGDWETEVREYLLGDDGWDGRYIDRVWSGRRFPVTDDWLDKSASSFFQLHLLIPRA